MTARRLLVVALVLAAAGGVFLALSHLSGSKSPAPILTIFYTGERLGYLEPCGCDDALLGGFPRAQSVIRGTALLGGPTLVVENGDLNDHPEAQDRLKYQYQIQALNMIGCAAFNLGEQDLSLGLAFLLERADEADFPFLSANLADPEGVAPFASSVIVTREVEGVPRTVQIIGVLAESMDLFIQETGLVVGSAREAIETALSESADSRIVLFHGDRQEARKAVRGLLGIDLVIATSHEKDEPFESIEEGLPPHRGERTEGKAPRSHLPSLRRRSTGGRSGSAGDADPSRSRLA